MKFFDLFYRLAVLGLLTFGCVQLSFLVRKADDFASTRDIESAVSSICGGSSYSLVSLSDLQKSIDSYGSAERALRDMASSLDFISRAIGHIEDSTEKMQKALDTQHDTLRDIESGISRVSGNMPGNEVSYCEQLLNSIYDLLEENFFPQRYKKRMQDEAKERDASPLEFFDD